MSDHPDLPSDSQRHAMISVAAYYLAERRGFAPGGAEADWLLAERMIDAMIAASRLTDHLDDETRTRRIRNALVLQEAAGEGAGLTTPGPPAKVAQT
ncbi:MAG: DUF2934 domain-containing protein [Thermochromatium sp.]